MAASLTAEASGTANQKRPPTTALATTRADQAGPGLVGRNARPQLGPPNSRPARKPAGVGGDDDHDQEHHRQQAQRTHPSAARSGPPSAGRHRTRRAPRTGCCARGSAASPGWPRSAAPAGPGRQNRAAASIPASAAVPICTATTAPASVPCTSRPHSQLTSSATSTTSTANGMTPARVKASATAPIARPAASRRRKVVAEARRPAVLCAVVLPGIVVFAHALPILLPAFNRSTARRRRRTCGRAGETRRWPAAAARVRNRASRLPGTRTRCRPTATAGSWTAAARRWCG